MKFFYEHRGSISIFLLCIMMAMLFFSFAVLDFAKVDLANAESRNNTSLAAAAALTNYDKALADAYGLLASSSTVDELSEKVAEYYVSTMAASGIKVDSDSEIYNAIRDLIRGKNDATENNNMLNLIPTELENGGKKYASGLVVDPILASSVSNPKIMRRQIVEYMKYRAPLSLATGFLEKLAVLKDTANQTQATSDRLTYEQDLGKVQKWADVCYDHINSYIENINNTVNAAPGHAYEADIKYGKDVYVSDGTERSKLQGSLKDTRVPTNHHDIMFDTWNELELTMLYAELLDPYRAGIPDSGSMLNKRKSITNVSGDSKPPLDKVSQLISQMRSYQVKTGDRYLYNYLEDIASSSFPAPNDLLLGMGAAGNFSDDMEKLFVISKGVEGLYDRNINVDNKFAGYYMQFMALYYEIRKYEETLNGDALVDFEEELAGISELEPTYNLLKDVFGLPQIKEEPQTAGKLDKYIFAYKERADSRLGYYNSLMTDYGTVLTAQLCTAEYMSGENSPLKELYEEIKQAKEDSEKWKDSIGKVETTSIKASMDSTYELEGKFIDDLSEEDVNAMMADFAAQADVYRSLYDDFRDRTHSAVDGSYFTLYNASASSEAKKVKEDNPYPMTFGPKYEKITDMLPDWSRQGKHISASYSMKQSVYMCMISGTKPEVRHVDEASMKNYAAVLDPASGSNSRVMDLLRQISEKNIIPADKESSEQYKKDDSKKDDKEKEANTKDGIFSLKKTSINNAYDTDAKSAELSKEEAAANSDSGNGGNNDGQSENGKDFTGDIYNAETFEQYVERNKKAIGEQSIGGEGDASKVTYNSGSDVNLDDEDKYGDVNLEGIKSMMSSVKNLLGKLGNIGENIRDDIFITEYLTQSFGCLTTPADATGITGKKLRDNAYYDCELEYIIYGCKTKGGNQAAAIASISGIRFVLNLIYSFTDSEINATTSGIATSLTFWIPFAQPIVKAVLHIVLSTAETAFDMLVLTDTETEKSVPLYKNSRTWVCKCSNAAGKILEEATKRVITAAEKNISEFIDGKVKKGEQAYKEMSDEFVEQQKEAIRSTLTGAIITPIESFIDEMVRRAEEFDSEADAALSNLYDSICDTLENLSTDIVEYKKSDGTTYKSDTVMASAGKAMSTYLRNNKSTLYGKIKGIITDSLSNLTGGHTKGFGDILKDCKAKFKSVSNDIIREINGVIDGLKDKIDQTVEAGFEYVGDLAKNGTKMAADKAINAINSKINEHMTGARNISIVDDKSSFDSNGTISNLLNMTYKDYLYIFLFLGLCGKSDHQLMRAAQIMEYNIGNGYKMNEAHTMFNVSSSSKIKTSVIGRIADSEGVTMSNFSDGYYKIYVTSFAGY